MPKPKTAYELLERVCEHILEEPRRYYQDSWGYTDPRTIAEVVGSVPACGTTGCRGGWIVGLNDGMKEMARLIATDGIYGRANRILGLHQRDSYPLFLSLTAKGKAGTMAYAKRGVAGLRAFMAKHEAHLKARLLADVPKLDSRS